MAGPVVYTEKCCSVCGKVNWDSDTGGYRETHQLKGKPEQACDIIGEVYRYDANNQRVY